MARFYVRSLKQRQNKVETFNGKSYTIFVWQTVYAVLDRKQLIPPKLYARELDARNRAALLNNAPASINGRPAKIVTGTT